jgi:hypothetical protein
VIRHAAPEDAEAVARVQIASCAELFGMANPVVRYRKAF